MHIFSSLLLLAGLCAALPASEGGGIVATTAAIEDGVSYTMWLASLSDTLRASIGELNNKTVSTTDARAPAPKRITRDGIISKRVDMYLGKKYNVAGWVFSIGAYTVQDIGSTSWRFPRQTDFDGMNYIADQIATSVRSVIGDSYVSRNVGGGWTWTAQLSKGYDYDNIPYLVIYNTVFEAIQGAVDWISKEKYAAYQMVDSNGQQIAIFSFYPTNGNLNEISNVHTEL